jgi:autotransporter-associated beta strand protein
LTIGDTSGNYWAPAVGGGGTGTWTTTSPNFATMSGVQGSAPQGATGVVHFTDAAGTVTVDNTAGQVTVNSGMQFSTDGYHVTGGQLALGGGSQAANTITVDTGTTTIDNVLTGSGGMTVAGPGTLVLTGDGTFTGGTTIASGGKLQLGSGGTTGSLTGAINILGNLIVDHGVNNYTLANDLSGSGGLTKNGSGTLSLTGDDGVYTGTATVNAGVLNVMGNFGGTVVNNTGTQSTYDSSGSGSSNVSGNVQGNVAFTQSGSGTTTLSGSNNTYTGATSVTAGTLVVSGSVNGTSGATVSSGAILRVADGGSFSTASGGTVQVSGTFNVNGTTTASGGVDVLSGGLLNGHGTINGAVDIAAGGTLSPGNSIAVETMSSLTLHGGSTLNFEFANVGGTAGTGWDEIQLGSGVLNLGDASAVNQITINVNALESDKSTHDPGLGGGVAVSNNFDPTHSYQWLFIATTDPTSPVLTGFGDLQQRFLLVDDLNAAGVFGTGNAFDRPLSSLGQGTFSVAYSATGIGGQGAGLYITYSAIPEPGSMLLAGLASLGAGWYGRRRKQQAQAVAVAPQSEPTV